MAMSHDEAKREFNNLFTVWLDKLQEHANKNTVVGIGEVPCYAPGSNIEQETAKLIKRDDFDR